MRISESVDASLFAGVENFDRFGWGRPAGDSGHAADLEATTAFYDDCLDVIARMLGLDSCERRFTAGFAHATQDLDLPGRPMAAGTVAGIEMKLDILPDLDGIRTYADLPLPSARMLRR